MENEPKEKWFQPGKGTATPWGKADCCTKYATGIISYSTPSHGGYHLSLGRMKQLPEMIQEYWDSSCPWFEEDCNWALVVLAFPQYFTYEHHEDAIRTVRQWHKNFDIDKYLAYHP